MVALQSIIERIQKLLALTNSSNPGEAANAAAAADKLIQKYQLTQAELQASSHEEIPVSRFPTPIYTSTRRTMWKSHLATNLASHYDCSLFIQLGRELNSRNKTSSYTLVGRTEDCEIAIFMFNWIVNEIEGLAKSNASGKGYAFSQTYCEGAGDGVIEKIRLEKNKLREEAKRDGKEAAIVLLNNKAIQARNKLEQLFPSLKSLKKSAHLSGAREKNINAYFSGKEAGKNINLGKGLTGGQSVKGNLT